MEWLRVIKALGFRRGDSVDKQALIGNYIGSLEQLMADTDSRQLNYFAPRFRVEDDDYRIIKSAPSQVWDEYDLSFTSPNGLIVFNSMQLTSYGTLMWRDYFARGAASVSGAVQEDDLIKYSQLLQGTLEVMSEVNQYPATTEQYIERQISVAQEILDNEEPSNREQLLAYNTGIWWGLGHLQGIDMTTVEPHKPYNKARRLVDWIHDTQINRAKNAMIPN